MELFKLDSYEKIALLLLLRYAGIAFVFWVIWYVLICKKVAYKKIQARFPKGSDYRREVGYSMLSLLIFSAVPTLMLLTPFRQYTLFYSDINEYGTLYFWLAFPVMFLFHDAYFYWTHRAMHHPRLFRLFHLVHHKSTNPSPWAALSFHPLEAVVEAGVFAVMLMIFPLHSWHLFIFFAGMMVYNVYGHLGWELYPRGFNRHPVGRWVNTSLSHNQHHQFFKGNYGLYFLWWDRWFGTLREDYDAQFERVKGGRAVGAPEVSQKEPAPELV